ncbi:hypothetical protein ACFSB1_05795 [Halopseudomonas phragmitis]|uniref:hypothetical protein n=1 Tax=Halopseudomonas phragmitis TaxID=1931241 RepID=UPI0012BA6B44|nr:hypothetical protein [Halopseudomonas phragmitis]
MLSLNWMIYGKDHPSLARRHCVHGITALAILTAWGLKSDFIASESWSSVGLYLSLFITAVLTALPWYGYITKKIKMQRELKKLKFTLFLMLIPPLTMMFIYTGLVHGAPSIITAFFGSDRKVVQELEKATFFNKRHCNYRLEGDFLDRALPSHICINLEYYSSSPDLVQVTLSGKENYFGFLIGNVSSASR